jgi:carboxylate-amine ligase
MEFAPSAPFTVGIEEELLLVDARTGALEPVADRILARMGTSAEEADHEVYAASLELRSPPSSTCAGAVDALDELRAAAREAGATLMGVGVHPAAEDGDAPLVDTHRYRRVGETMRGLIRRTPECALHVHVGMPDAETAVRSFNGLRAHLPLLQGLSANSPWWFGRDSGLASARAALVRSYPGRGIPRAFRDVADWEETVAAATAAGDLADYTYLWWDVRLHPKHGTIELREMDSQSSLAAVASLAALVRALAREQAEAPLQSMLPPEALAWSAFRAMRDGVSATILHDGRLRPLAEIARVTVKRVRPIARELGDEDALDGIEAMVADGGSAGRQRTAVEQGGLRTLLDMLIEQTAARPALARSRR